MNNEIISNKIKKKNTGDFGSICIEKVENNTLIDYDGKKYLDFSSGYGVANIGWKNEKVIEEIKSQLDVLSYSTLSYPTLPGLQLSEQLLDVIPGSFHKCARAISGADANEVIIKASLAYNGKKKVLSLDKGYHGGTKSTVSISSDEFNLPRFPSLVDYIHVPTPYCFRCPMGKDKTTCKIDCALKIESIIKDNSDIGLFIMEPVIGSGGVIIPPDEYFEIAYNICKKHNIVFAFDEVITGLGRIGAMSAIEKFKIVPDAISIAKGLGGGIMPIGAALLSKELADSLEKYEDVTGTFAWTPVACVAAKTTIDILTQELVTETDKKGGYLIENIKQIFNKHIPSKIGEIRGIGMLIGIELIDSKTGKNDFELMNKFYSLLIQNGLMVSTSWLLDVVIIMPPLNISKNELNEGLKIIEKTIIQIK